MEVYVDNVKMEMKQKSFKSLGNAISAINKKLMKENKIPHEIYVNGSTLRDNSIIGGKDLKVIEVITKTHGAMILESILIAKESIDRYFDIFDDIEESGQESLNDEDEIQFIEMVIFLRWFYNLLLLIKENHILDFIYEDFDEYIEDFQKELEVAEHAYERRDLIGFIDILEFSIGDLLIEFYDNVEDYYNDIAEEENRKRLLN
ncbi:chemotaxis protein [Fusobacterium sp.]|uniref:chemotaxis protein n=1 Tax=Fusobacterium sp. TaxID=68766 RepID=UPI0029055AE3|nr:chemotaxis protein [Fusobacterium sp.]MDU1910046.1 chemotaxis protein [Fusobacterium sp.]